MIGQSDGKSFAYLLGVYLGDGCVTDVWHEERQKSYKRFRLNTIDKDFAEATVNAIKDVTGKEYPVCGPYHDKRFPKSAPQHMIGCYDSDLCERLTAETDSKRKMPDWIFAADKEIRLAFIAGLMDSEGFVAERRNYPTNRRYFMGFKSCDLWVPEFVKLLEHTGIRTGDLRTEEPRKAHYKRPWVFKVKMQSWIDAGAYFKCSRKQKRVDEWGSIPPYTRRSKNPAKASPNEHTSYTER
jgi:hypothetical protein